MTPQPSEQPTTGTPCRLCGGVMYPGHHCRATDPILHWPNDPRIPRCNENCHRAEAVAPDPVASPLTILQLAAVLDRAWLASGDAQGTPRPPDLAEHLWEAIAAGSGTADERQASTATQPSAVPQPDPVASPALDVERLADFILGKIESEPYQGLHPELASMALAVALRDEWLEGQPVAEEPEG